MSSSLTRRDAVLYTLLRATLNRTAETIEHVPLNGIDFFQSSIRDRSSSKGFQGKLRAYSGHFLEGHATVRTPFHVVFAGSRQVSGIHTRMAVTGGVSVANQLRSLMSIMSHLVALGEITRGSFDEAVRVAIESHAGQRNNLPEVAAGFHAWASALIKRSGLDEEEKRQSIVELLAYELPVEHAA